MPKSHALQRVPSSHRLARPPIGPGRCTVRGSSCAISRRFGSVLAMALLALIPSLVLEATPPEPSYRVLAFTRTEGFRHSSIDAGLSALRDLGRDHGFEVTATESSAVFSDASLARFAAVVFLNTTGDVLDRPEEEAFERYIRGGGGFVGVHSATDTEYGWPWYGDLVGAWFDGHPAVQNATLHVEDADHESTLALPTEWMRRDEWYDFRRNPRDFVNVLLTIDESTYSGGSMGADHPIAWYREFDGGRSWYTAGGHTSAAYGEPLFRLHLLGGIEWAAGQTESPAAQQLPGDCNQDGVADVSDGVCLLLALFAGGQLPCDSEVAGDPARQLLDHNGDELLDLSDAVATLQHLFNGGPPHALGATCTSVEGCEESCSAR